MEESRRVLAAIEDTDEDSVTVQNQMAEIERSFALATGKLKS
jgi:hypothetical protein